MYYNPNYHPCQHHRMYHYYPQYQGYYQQRQYPDVDVETFEHSVTAFQKIADESSEILEKFADREFARRLMAAAQEGNQHEVDRLIKTIGIETAVTTQYTPSGILLTIHADAQGTQCCTLTMYLKWGI